MKRWAVLLYNGNRSKWAVVQALSRDHAYAIAYWKFPLWDVKGVLPITF